MHTAGFVLVGGLSARMGQDKALLSWHSQYLAEKIASVVTTVAGNVTLVGHPERYKHLHLPCISDRRPQLGPLAGIEAALESRKAGLNLIVGCDMPGVSTDVLNCLLDQASRTSACCVAAKDITGQIHPLCAVYRLDCLPIVRKSLEQGRLKMMKVLEDLRAEYFDVESSLANINTPEDWLRWQLSAK